MQSTIQQEIFELSLGIDDSRISPSDLIDFLANTEKLLNSINETLNTKFSIGFDNIDIEVIALEKGSFKIPLCIKKITKNPTFVAIVGAVLAPLATNLFTNNQKEQKVYYGEAYVVVSNYCCPLKNSTPQYLTQIQ